MTESKPTVSVIIPTYNRAALLVEALESVLAQSFQDFEVIIVDDGSNDDTAERLKPYLTDDRVRYFCQSNGGPARARNYGIRGAFGEYIALLDSDDLWLPAKLEKQVALLRANPDIGLTYSDVTWIDAAGQPMEPQPLKAQRRFPTYYEDLMFENVIYGPGTTVVIRRENLPQHEWYDELLPTIEDQDFFLRLSKDNQFMYAPEPLVLMRNHGSNLQHDPDAMATGRLRFLDKLKQDTPPTYRHHLPGIEYIVYRRIIFSYLLKRRFGITARYLWKMTLRNPGNLFRLLADALSRLPRARSAHWR